jgi:pentatricopeptide repeat protein
MTPILWTMKPRTAILVATVLIKRIAVHHSNGACLRAFASTTVKTAIHSAPQEKKTALKEYKQRDMEVDTIYYNRQLNAIVKAKDKDGAQQAMQEKLSAGIKPDQVTYNTMIKVFSSIGDTAEARKWLEAMKHHGIKPDVISYSTLLDGYVKAKDKDGATQVMQEMLSAGIKPDVYTRTIMQKASWLV